MCTQDGFSMHRQKKKKKKKKAKKKKQTNLNAELC